MLTNLKVFASFKNSQIYIFFKETKMLTHSKDKKYNLENTQQIKVMLIFKIFKIEDDLKNEIWTE